MNEEKKEKDPFVIDKPNPRADYQREMEKRALRPSKDADALAAAKEAMARHDAQRGEAMKKELGGKVIPDDPPQTPSAD